MLGSLYQGLKKTRSLISGAFGSLFSGSSVLNEDSLEKLEEALVLADVSFGTVIKILENLKERNRRDPLAPGAIRDALKKSVLSLFTTHPEPEPTGSSDGPLVILVVGVNGTGKTTSIGKLAHRYVREGKKVLIAACDTFRSAAAEQLGYWAQRAGAEMVRQEHGSDPAAVAFDAYRAARSRKADILLIDTAGRLHTKLNLMEELKKIKRVLAKNGGGIPHRTLIVLDAGVGQNGLAQAKSFHEALGLTGIILTKLDGTAKGGIVLSIRDQLDIPIRMIGVGEDLEDLRDFKAEEYVEALLAPF